VLQLRPIEVMFEEWAALRLRGVATPQIAVWQRLHDPGSTMWWFVMTRLYLNATYQRLDLVMRDPASGHYVMFVPELPPSYSNIPAILASHNIILIYLWANLSPQQYASGMWVFMAPCTNGGVGPNTNVAGTVCQQGKTTNSLLGPSGTALTVGPSYQLLYSSLPFQAASKLGGLTLRKQFVRAFSDHPDYLLVAAYNEMIAQPQANPFYATTHKARSMGLPWDPDATALWVDMYASEGRDLAPTVEDGDIYWQLARSCLRVYALGGVCVCVCEGVCESV
jgi:hypothetical protein